MPRLSNQGAVSGILEITCGILAVLEGDRHVTWLNHMTTLSGWKGLLRLLDQLLLKRNLYMLGSALSLKYAQRFGKCPPLLLLRLHAFKQGVVYSHKTLMERLGMTVGASLQK